MNEIISVVGKYCSIVGCLHLDSLRSSDLDFHLLPEGVDKEPTKKGEGEVEDDLDDDDIVVQLVDVEEEDHQDAHEVDCKVKGHPDERREDELVF